MVRVGIIGATGMVGQRFVLLLQNHPWFQITCVAASARSAGKPYRDAVGDRWAFESTPIPGSVADMTVMDAGDIQAIKEKVDFVFCAIALSKPETRALEDAYAKAEIPVISNNSACRGMDDVPMLIPEINGNHVQAIEAQKKRLGTKRGFITVKPNCSIQSYVPAIWPLLEFEPAEMVVCTYQSISGAGKTFATWPEMIDNVNPLIPGEDEKSEVEPMKIFGSVMDGHIVNAKLPVISAQCLRVPTSDGHLAAVSVKFKQKPTIEQILERWQKAEPATAGMGLPTSPAQFLK
ncbi:MAG: aspartate-semialdehyde dehydrogenase, partial [Firmicutes bacterium]|nr:aspartate-semialdehyde dehydrogenase [Bacillota bacterium]